MQLLKLVAHQIKAGAPLPFGVRDEHGKLLLGAGQMIASDSQLEALLERGLYADIEEVRAYRARYGQAGHAQTRRLTLFDMWEQAIWRLQRLFESAATPGAEFEAPCREFAAQLMMLVQRDPDVGIYLSMRQDERRLNLYGVTHSLHTALVCQLMATRLGWPAGRTTTLVLAALTMNIAIHELQGKMAVLGRPSEAQRELIRLHPDHGVALLRQTGVRDEAWLRTVVQHHEHPNGTGYPHALHEVDELALALSLADVFMAKISPRAQRAALPIQEAARQMYTEARGHAVASPIAAAIIKEYGIYPPGDFVQLASGELAVVIRRGATAHTPQAAAITDRTGLPVVSTLRRDTAQAAFAIVGPAQDRKLAVRVPPERLFGLLE